MTRKWLRERQRDYYHRLAKEEGYRSRAAYKLLEAAEKYHFIKPGDVVLDLGAAPGGWMQAASKLVGEEGCVLGVDLKPVEDLKLLKVSSIVGDIEKIEPQGVLKLLPREADVVLSDLAPNVSGVWELDHTRQIYLSEASLRLAVAVLRVRGSFFLKVFQGSGLDAFLENVKAFFGVVRVIKPRASRKSSAEIYVLAMGFNGKRA